MPREVLSFNAAGMPELQDLLNRMEGKGADGALEGAHNWLDFTFEVAQRNVPVDTGELAGSGEVIKTRKGGSILYRALHAAAVHWGYIRHLIKPKRGKALRWEAEEGGRYQGRLDRLNKRGSRKDIRWAFSKGHFVPKRASRTLPQPWLENAVRGSLQYLAQFMVEGFDKAIKGGA